jgi:hypothetical protein
MQAGNVYEHLSLLGPDGQPLPRALLPLDPPLWNTDRTVLTLWLEPGRIKRDLGPNRRLGPILVAEQDYTLVAAASLPDANGQPLETDFRYAFTVGERDTLRPDPATWQLAPPPANSRQSLGIELREALDWATAMTYLQIRTAEGSPLAGSWELSGGEHRLAFRPTQAWVAGTYELHIDPRLEDPAGNNLRRLFDREAGKVLDPGELRSRLTFRIE